MTNFNKVCRLALALLIAPVAAYAVNVIPAKPDAANDAPMTVFGSPNNCVSVGKTTACTEKVEVQGNMTVSGTISGTVSGASLSAGSVDSTKLSTAAVTTAKIAAGAVDTTKLKSGAVDTGKIACFKPDNSIGFCASALTGGASPICSSCQ